MWPLAGMFVALSDGATAPSEALENSLRAIADAGRSAWPDVSLDDERLVSHLARRTGGDEAALRSICAADIFLACACNEGDAAAVRSFERHYLSRVPEFLRTMRAASDFADDVRQVLGERLLVGSVNAPPKIGDYSGRGSLAAWLRIAALRTALNLKPQRREEPEERGARVAGILEARANPERDYLRQRYTGAFVDALRGALGTLRDEQRQVLRLHFAHGLTGEQIAQTMQVHRATVVRWIRSAREDVLREALRRLHESTRISKEEHASLFSVLESQIDVTCSQLLGRE